MELDCQLHTQVATMEACFWNNHMDSIILIQCNHVGETIFFLNIVGQLLLSAIDVIWNLMSEYIIVKPQYAKCIR